MTIEQKIDRIDSNISMLIDQVGRMTEGITELRLVVTDGFTEIKESLAKMDESLEKLKQVTEEQAKTSAEQTTNITRLAMVAESQAVTADNLAKLVGQFLRDKQER